MEEYLQSRDETVELQNHAESAEKVLSFAEIKHLIETGQAHLIPNNKMIEEKINDLPPSVSLTRAKPKPWENSTEIAKE
ncbi:hypothetical protein FRC14_005150 [Serendipita sp. 396]|nr:hypothetical protein FRC14_005150 [Serendipita sp. 396]KAG8797586.1 hypothetical protein FRC16_008728 [Serendipita sp. 398]KAG8878053.1 hypothetical protein FRC20_009338 [Serendipita sp. 405]KAG9052831.1 hypothetical protein FS842_009176 [Serendipita sp. 407]